jgi:hypothetical protein
VGENALQVPATAHVVAHDRVKHVGSISPCRRSFTDHLLDLTDAVSAAGAVEAITADRRLIRLATLTPHESPVKDFIDVLELTDRRIERVTRDRERLVAMAEQLGRNLLAFDLQRELAIQGFAICKAPNPAAFA